MRYLVQNKNISLHLQPQIPSHSFLQFLQLGRLVATPNLNQAISPGGGLDGGQGAEGRLCPGPGSQSDEVLCLWVLRLEMGARVTARRIEVTGSEPGRAWPSPLVARWRTGIRGCCHWPPEHLHPPGDLALASGGSASAELSDPQQEASSLHLIYQCQKLGFFQPPYRICFLTLLL